jgi:AcrR family transcriptional regulator
MPEPAEDSMVRKRYASPAMAARRERIVECAHIILGEGGTEALTIQRLCRDAGVASRTIYRLFGDKEGVILATVTDRLREVRASLAVLRKTYDLDTVLAELDWMVDEMRRDVLYGRVVIGFFFSQEPREAAVRELGSVAYHRVRQWLDGQLRAGHAETHLDLDRIAREHVAQEFVCYHGWTVHDDDRRCRIELRCCFLKTAITILKGAERRRYVAMLADHQRQLGLTALGAAPSPPSRTDESGVDFLSHC